MIDTPYARAINLVTTLDLVTVFQETESVTKSRFHCTYFGKTFSLPVTMIEGGRDTLDNRETEDVDAEDGLEFGINRGEENTGAVGLEMARPLPPLLDEQVTVRAPVEAIVVEALTELVGAIDGAVDGIDDKLGNKGEEDKVATVIGMSLPCRLMQS